MTRRRVTSKEATRLLAANELADAVQRKGPKKTKFGKKIEILVEEATERANGTHHWDDAKPSVLVGLYAYCHAEVYGAPPLELQGETLRKATLMAAAFVKKEFNGDVVKMVEFMQWVWRRERGREDWRNKNGKGGGRITWQNQFVQRYLLTDYRVWTERQKGNQ